MKSSWNFDENKSYLNQQEEEHGDNPFAAFRWLFLAKSSAIFQKIKNHLG